MKILTIKENKSLGLEPEKIYNQIVSGFKKMRLPVEKWCESISLEEDDDIS